MYFITKYLVLLLYILMIYSFGLLLQCFYYTDFIHSYIYQSHVANEFDYIIVGTGSAGAIVIHHLSLDKNLRILVLEAGGGTNDLVRIPSIGLLLHKSVYDWQYVTTPQLDCCRAFVENASTWPRGKMIGGSSMLNNMLYVRGHKSDLDEWYDYQSELLPYYQKIEELYGEKIDKPPFITELSRKIIKTARKLGYSVHDSLDTRQGFTVPKIMLTNSKRWSPALKIDWTNPNLILRKYSQVQKVLFQSNFEARAVQYEANGQTYEATAKEGIILAAGTIGSAQILLQSGVGPKKHLQEVGIKPIKNLPVGENLQDHIGTGLDLVIVNHTLGLGISGMISPLAAWDYFVNSKGPWLTVGCELSALFSRNYLECRKQNGNCSHFLGEKPDLQLMVLPVGVSSDSGLHLQSLSGISKASWEKYFKMAKDQTAITVLPIVLHPKSRGTIRLNKKGSLEIDSKYLSHPDDVTMIIKGLKLIQTLFDNEIMRKFGTKLNDIPFPGCENHKFASDIYWECYIRHLTVTSYHPIGTCAIDAVVDRNFKVIGLDRLWVVDGSVLPTLPSANINAAIMMMAEKAVEAIRYDKFLRFGVGNLWDYLYGV